MRILCLDIPKEGVTMSDYAPPPAERNQACLGAVKVRSHP